MTAILLGLSPFIVSGLTALIKKIPALANMQDGPYTVIIRIVVFVLSLGTVIGTYITSGIVDTDALTTIVLTFLTFMSATGIHFFSKKS